MDEAEPMRDGNPSERVTLRPDRQAALLRLLAEWVQSEGKEDFERWRAERDEDSSHRAA